MQSFEVIYEDNHLLLGFKPEGIPSQEDATGKMDFLSLGKRYLKEKYKKEGAVYLALLHRLDRPVSGLMLFAKTSKAAARLSEQIRKHQWEKTYLAVCHGKFAQNKGSMEDDLYKNAKENKSYVARTEKEKKNFDAKKSSLQYEVLAYNEEKNLSLVLVHLETGRHHQIRVQFSSRGHALLFDQKYSQTSSVGNPCLSAVALSFFHPITQEKKQFYHFHYEKPGFHFFEKEIYERCQKCFSVQENEM